MKALGRNGNANKQEKFSYNLCFFRKCQQQESFSKYSNHLWLITGWPMLPLWGGNQACWRLLPLILRIMLSWFRFSYCRCPQFFQIYDLSSLHISPYGHWWRTLSRISEVRSWVARPFLSSYLVWSVCHGSWLKTAHYHLIDIGCTTQPGFLHS